MKSYEFTLHFKLPGKVPDSLDIMNTLSKAGCTDTLVGLGVSGYVSIQFNRTSRTALAALKSALKDVRKALPGAVLVEAKPDLVCLSEVADFAGVTKQSLRKMMEKNGKGFPHPRYSGSRPIWHLTDVLECLASERLNRPGFRRGQFA
jgi:hypothetical protein